jgi:hypothetical protein
MLRPVLAWHAFETYEPFIPLIFQFFSGCGKLRITETMDCESADMGAQLYISIKYDSVDTLYISKFIFPNDSAYVFSRVSYFI